MPDDYEELTRNGDNRFLFPNAYGKPLELLFPLWMMRNRHPCRLDEGRSHLFSPLLSNISSLVGLARSMDTRPQASISNEMLRDFRKRVISPMAAGRTRALMTPIPGN